MQRWQYPIYNGNLIKYELDINDFVSLNYLFSFVVSLQKWLTEVKFFESENWRKLPICEEINVSRFQGFKVSRFQGFKVSRF